MASPTLALAPSPAELHKAAAGAASWFGTAEPAPEAWVEVLQNHDAVQKQARAGRPLNLAGRELAGGLFCHAPSRLMVHLPAPAARFEAVIGVDSNEQTSGGRGSVTFAVLAGERELFRSPLLREGAAPLPVTVELAGARAFELRIDDGGDGISCDQADWAEARIQLADGRALALADLPLIAPSERPQHDGLPVSFQLDGRPSSEFLGEWTLERSTRALDDQRDETTLVYRQPGGGLSLRVVTILYRDFAVLEWTAYLHWDGPGASPLVSGFQALETSFDRCPWPDFQDCEFFLHQWTGSPCTAGDFAPHSERLARGRALRFAPPAGRPSDSVWPYFAVEWPSQGVLVAVGWPGQWAAEFARDDGVSLRLRAGQELTRFRLQPGESVRSPLIAVQWFDGPRVRAHNLWRRWMLAHNLPRPLAPQFAACSSHQFGEMIHADEASQIRFVDGYVDHGLQLDYWWMDAGWYPNQGGWPNTGTWRVDPTRFPRGLRYISDHARRRGVKTIVWFEPERVTPGTELYERRDWLLGPDGGQKLLNLGHPEARAWLTEHVDGMLREQGIDLYRQDFNMDPLGYWRANDAEDRQGITENRHVTGYLAYWDELRRRHPGMLIDSCASGGRRNDLETLRRAVPLLRSDYIIEPIGNQGHTYGLSSWLPYYGTGTGRMDTYGLRSVFCPAFNACWDMRRDDLPFESLRASMAEWAALAECQLGDYYPLTGYSLARDVWIGWQWDRPEEGRGAVQVFRREDSPYEVARFRLAGLAPTASYELTGLGEPLRATGEALARDGLRVELTGRPDSAVVFYRRLEQGQ